MPAKRIIIFDTMRILKICVLLLGVNILLPTIAIHFVDVTSDVALCALIEDSSEEEEEDGEFNDLMEFSSFFRDWQNNGYISSSLREHTSIEMYPENNNQLRSIHLEVQTPPPKHTLG